MAIEIGIWRIDKELTPVEYSRRDLESRLQEILCHDITIDEFDATAMCSWSLSPILVEGITPLKSGQGVMKLNFFHANYPSGVQGKEYTLQTMHRGKTGLLARSIGHKPPRFLYVTELTMHWLQHNFPSMDAILWALHKTADGTKIGSREDYF